MFRETVCEDEACNIKGGSWVFRKTCNCHHAALEFFPYVRTGGPGVGRITFVLRPVTSRWRGPIGQRRQRILYKTCTNNQVSPPPRYHRPRSRRRCAFYSPTPTFPYCILSDMTDFRRRRLVSLWRPSQIATTQSPQSTGCATRVTSIMHG